MQNGVQVFNRPMTDAERMSVNNVYALTQKGARMVGGLAIGFAFFAVLMESVMGSVDAMISILFALLMIVFGVLGLGVTFSMFKIRKTIGEVQKAGSVITVRGPATKVTGTNKQSWSVGPLTMNNTPESVKVPQEGTATELVCVPKLKSVISMNGAGLEQAISATIPKDLEAMSSVPPAPAMPSALGAANMNPQPVLNHSASRFCPSCGASAAGTRFCPRCGYKL